MSIHAENRKFCAKISRTNLFNALMLKRNLNWNGFSYSTPYGYGLQLSSRGFLMNYLFNFCVNFCSFSSDYTGLLPCFINNKKMRYVAAYLLASLGGSEDPSAKDLQKILGSVGIDCEDERAKSIIGSLSGKNLEELIANG